MRIFHFGHGRVGGAVGIYDAVAKEIPVAGHIGAAVIAAIFPEMTTVFIHGIHSLIHPIPNVSALQVRVFVNGFPLNIEVSV